jgi:hypothetical protein
MEGINVLNQHAKYIQLYLNQEHNKGYEEQSAEPANRGTKN